MLRVFTLSNGIQVATYHMPTVKSFHLGITVKSGSLVEKPNESGIAHFMEHMLVQGIPSFPTAETLSNYIETLAGRYNAFTSLFTVHFSITLPFSSAEEGIKIASEVFFEPVFPEVSLEKERQAVLNEMKQEMDSRWFKFRQFFRQTRYTPDSRLQLTTIGTPEVVATTTREDLMHYWQKYFLPKNTYIFIQGNFDPDQIQSWLEHYFSPYTSKRTFAGYPLLSVKKDFSPRQVAIREDTLLQVNYLDLVFPSLALEDPLEKRIKQNMLLGILGGLRTSRLFTLLRYQKGLVYSVHSGASQSPGVGMVTASSEVAPQHLDEVTRLMLEEVKKVMEKPITRDELVLIKNYLSNSWLMAFDNPGSIGTWIENDFLWQQKILLPEDYIAMIKEITAKDLTEVAKEYWDVSKLNLIIQGPTANNEENREKFEKMMNVLR